MLLHSDTPIIHIRHMNNWWRWGFPEGAGRIRFCLVLGGGVDFGGVGERVGMDGMDRIRYVPH